MRWSAVTTGTLCTGLLGTVVLGAPQPQVIDFETLPGGAPTTDEQFISTEYLAEHGVSFELLDRVTGEPIGVPRIAKTGAPLTAFEGCIEPDTPLPGQGLGESMLTDNSSLGVSGDLLVTYATPVAQASAVIIDMDCRVNGGPPCEQWTISALDANQSVLDQVVIDAPQEGPNPDCINGDAGAGDSVAFGWSFDLAEPVISFVLISYTGAAPNVGLAFDNFSPSELLPLSSTIARTPDFDPVCVGELVRLEGLAVGGLPPYTYTWQEETAPGTWIDIGIDQTIALPYRGTGRYRLIVMDSVGTVSSNEEPVSPCVLQVEVSQESVPDAGDFDDHVLAIIGPIVTDETAAGYYGYQAPGDPFSGPEPELVDDRAHLFMLAGADGISVFMVYDDPAGVGGGRAETESILTGDAATFLVRDDGTIDVFQVLDGGTRFVAGNTWTTGNTDGYAIGDLVGDWSMIMEFADVVSGVPTLEGLSSWTTYSSGGSEIALALEEDRRVRLRAIRIPTCLGDIDASGDVGFADLLAVLSNWGPCLECPEDLDGDGIVGFSDLLIILSNWGPCLPF